ncbi:MAG: ATP-binding protein [Defluviitaleaceae bacterium]|nr:ATP-binding protein [Defluviitaleaceae bacterium]
MKFTLEHFGAIRYAELNMGDLTIICGENNSGKTYVTYAVYGFMYFWDNVYQINIDSHIIKKIKDTGFYNLQLSQIIKDAHRIIEKACREYTGHLASVFSAHESKFDRSVFRMNFSSDELIIDEREHTGGIHSTSTKTGLRCIKEAGGHDLTITLFSEEVDRREIPDFIVIQAINSALKAVVFSSILPNTFIASAERTGAAIFRRELNFARNKILDTMSKKDAEFDPFVLLSQIKSDYAWPVDHNVDFARSLEDVFKSESDILKKHKSIIDNFSDILGGSYHVTDKDGLFFAPSNKNNGRKMQLSMDESSSSVRALLNIGFYLKHIAKVGDMLVIDEPELNLHPRNQRKMARLLVSLINCGIKVFITTHSDYILRELNNLLLLNGGRPHLVQIAEREGYAKTELLKSSSLRVYAAKAGLVQLPGNSRKTQNQTLVAIPIDDKIGIYSSSFDDVINEMNRITDDIMFGG